MQNCVKNKYIGAIHIHSKFSDGSGDIKAICRAARRAGLSWIVITDHNNMDIEEGFIEGVCAIKGEEISPSNNHYLALGINNLISPCLSPSEITQAVRAQGGFGIASHPDESDNRKNTNHPIKWLDKAIKPDGVEIWNWFSTFADNFCDNNIFKIMFAYLFKHKLITPPKRETLSWWDDLNSSSNKIVPAIGGLDAHALKIKKYIFPVTIFPYKNMFKTIANVIYLDDALSSDFKVAKEQILSAIKEGRNLIVNRKICRKIPQINISNLTQVANCGEVIMCDNNTSLNIELARKYEIKVLRDGEEIFTDFSKRLKLPINKKGKYRVEIKKDKLGYAYSNPIILN